MYKVIRHFTDLQDRNHAYRVGDEYPRAGLKVNQKRIEELSTSNNKRGVPFIGAVTVKEDIKKTVSEVKEQPQEKKTDANPPKKPRAKRSTKKTQE